MLKMRRGLLSRIDTFQGGRAMANKRKVRGETDKRKDNVCKNRRLLHSTNFKNGTKKQKEMEVKKINGPRLLSKLREEIDMLNPKSMDLEVINNSDRDKAIDVYEYEEEIPHEESKKNRRFDTVENYEYELPKNFMDEDVLSEDDEEEDVGSFREEYDEESRKIMRGIGSIAEVSEGEKMESGEDGIPDDTDSSDRDGDDHVSFNDLLAPLQGKPGFSKLRKMIHHVEQKAAPIHAPLPKVEEERVERKASYRLSNNVITKWEPLVKRNREAPTVYFHSKVRFPVPTVEIVASRFEPRTDFEKKMASIVQDEDITQAYNEDGMRLLELNKISVEEVKDRQNALAKMRSLLFQHEMKAKRIKKIKSKTYHRLLKRQKQKAAYADSQLDPEAAKELAIKQEFKRAEERMTRRHGNTSRWARRILHRGLNVQDEGTRAAISEQLHQHAILKRKMDSVKEGSSSSSDSSSDEGDGDCSDSDQKRASGLLMRAKEKTLQAVEEAEDGALNSGVLSLPFMVRGMKKRQEAAVEDAKLAIQEYESSLRKLDGTGKGDGKTGKVVTGRRVFNPPKKDVRAGPVRDPVGRNGSDTESERDVEEGGTGRDSPEVRADHVVTEDADIDLRFLREGSEAESEEPTAEKLDDIISGPLLRPEHKYRVSICGSESAKRVNPEFVDVDPSRRSPEAKLALNNLELKEERGEKGGEDGREWGGDDDSDDDSDTDRVRMVDGILTRVGGRDYELPSQEELIHLAFAGDDVEDEFRREKEAAVDEENPKPEEPVLLPGWGEWSKVQQKRGPPSWILKEHEAATKKREEALKKRKDAHLDHVVISERLDKKAELLQSKTVPYPYTSKHVFEQSMRMPIGPEFNPATSIGDLHRPEVVKKAGVIIRPIEFKEVNPYEKEDEKKKEKSGRRRRERRRK